MKNNLRTQEQELKRARGAISCAECRRLKLKCDKTIPCSSCKRRGCASICPNGHLTTGQGTRFVLADTEKLHRKIQEMSDRIRQLEDALAILQGTVTRESHPLLRRDLLQIKSGLELHGAAGVNPGDPNGGLQEEEREESETLDSFGTLAVREDGAATFYGRSAGSESLLLDHNQEGSLLPIPRGDLPHTASHLPEQITTLSHSFPAKPPEYAITDLQTLIERYLPPYDRAWTLCQSYLEQECWHYGAVTRRQLLEELFPYFYPESVDGDAPFITNPYAPGAPSNGKEKEKENHSGPHSLALMFVVLCFGALTDPNMPAAPENEEAEMYYQLSRAALNLEPVLEKPPSVATVQTVSLMAIYTGMCAGEHSVEATWAMWGLASKLAQSIGLHRDCARWNLTPSEVQKRRALFWELFITDCWQSLATGRLPTFSLSFVDTELPQDTEQTMADDGTILPSFPSWKARFGRECVSAVVQGTLTAKSPKYSVILELDRKIREIGLPNYPESSTPAGQRGLAETMKRLMPINYRHLTMLYVHRTFFAQALSDHPDDPLKSQYAPSFLAGFRSACALLASVRESFELFPREIARFWVLFTHGFSCSVMLSSVVTHGTKSKVAQAALMELRLAYDLYQRAAPYGGRAVKFLPIIRRLHDKATQTYLDVRHGLEAPRRDIFTPSRPDVKRDELSIFSGRTHTVATKTPPGPASRSTSRRYVSEAGSGNSPMEGASNTSTPPAMSDASHSPHSLDSEPYAGVHPTLVHQLQGFEGELNAQMHDAYYKNDAMRQWVDEINARIPVGQHAYPPEPQPQQYEAEPAVYQYQTQQQQHYTQTQETYVHEVHQQQVPLPPQHYHQPHQPQHVDPSGYYHVGPSVPVQQHHGHWHAPDPRMEQHQYMNTNSTMLLPQATGHPHTVDEHGAVLSGMPSEEPPQNYSLHENWSAYMQQWQMPGR